MSDTFDIVRRLFARCRYCQEHDTPGCYDC
jgi:hypothetical protein